MIDGVAALAIGLCFSCWVPDASVNDALADNRPAIYSTLASVFGALLGFMISAVSILLTITTIPLLQGLHRSAHYKDLWRAYHHGILALALGTVVSVVALIWDKDASPRWFLVDACALASALACARVARCVYLLSRVVDVVVALQMRVADKQ